ncbi:MAG: hypothetical protein BGO69_04980 [Bacteroidetes bacterium 46-16]|nr:MAG: hypothetical protein BGO69_04980 [Bacteroidetes bacterium 46-16]
MTKNAATETDTQKILLLCGIVSSLLYTLMNVFIPLLWPAYDSISQTVSELSAVGAPTQQLWISLGAIYSLLVAAFGLGIWQAGQGNGHLRIVGLLLLVYGLVSTLWPFAPMHQRAVLAAGGATMTDTMHLSLAAVTVFIMVLAMAFGAAAFGRSFRLYSVITILVMLVFGVLTALDAPKVQANLPTPYAGLWERINIGAFLLWVIVLAVYCYRIRKAGTRS